MTLPAAVEAALLDHARAAAPDECCGVLLGDGDHVRDAVPVLNTAADPRRQYRIDPADHFRVIRAARQRGLQVIGAYHSHPRTAAQPSATDRAEAFGDFLFLIIGLGSEPPELGAFRFERGNFVAVPLVRLR